MSVKAPFGELAAAVADEFGELHLFRPNRDVRFAKRQVSVQDDRSRDGGA